ncbi:hypothetical protein QT196_06870 [Streptomyces sp. P9-2B-2]|uniref:hypothetical protein n=1 Tax=Streptomyces TaxID=1883 RepID=UPI0022504F75|nr:MULTISPECIES: hypothetical protein [Streptomyces]MCX4638380.1 hypothetical protein [Streptomyces platensis]WJY37025.1 hypothetical protein QT196_06870 [Streptomyces sp. P9-2B-2]
MTYQQPPSQPGQQPPNPYGMYAPPPPKKRGTGAKVGIGCGGAFGALVLLGVIGAAIGGGDSGTPAEKPAKAAAAPASERAKEKAALGHVTKVQGADELNDILDSVDIYF